jgi:hypothetical protein
VCPGHTGCEKHSVTNFCHRLRQASRRKRELLATFQNGGNGLRPLARLSARLLDLRNER